MTKISNRHIKAWEKFNEELKAFTIETEEDCATLYEDACTTRYVKDFHMTTTGMLTWVEEGQQEKEQMFDEDDAKEYLLFWKGCLRRAKRYWSMDAIELDRLQDSETNDDEEDE